MAAFLSEVSGPPATDVLPSHWIFDRLEEWAKRSPDQFAFAVDHQDRIEEYSYADVLDQTITLSAALLEQGIRCGDRVGILMENIPHWVFVLLGTMRIGAVAVPLATTLPENSVRLIAEHAGCRLIFADEPNREKAS